MHSTQDRCRIDEAEEALAAWCDWATTSRDAGHPPAVQRCSAKILADDLAATLDAQREPSPHLAVPAFSLARAYEEATLFAAGLPRTDRIWAAACNGTAAPPSARTCAAAGRSCSALRAGSLRCAAFMSIEYDACPIAQRAGPAGWARNHAARASMQVGDREEAWHARLRRDMSHRHQPFPFRLRRTGRCASSGRAVGAGSVLPAGEISWRVAAHFLLDAQVRLGSPAAPSGCWPVRQRHRLQRRSLAVREPRGRSPFGG